MAKYTQVPVGASATDASFKYRSHNMIRFYYGIVEEVDANFVIRFRIPGILDNLDKYPPAHPITKNTSQVFKGDHVLIMQLDVANQDYVYFNNDEKPFIGIRYGDLVIDLDTGKLGKPQMDLMVVGLKEEEEDSEVEDNVIEAIDTGISLNHDSVTTGVYSGLNFEEGEDGSKVIATNNAISREVLEASKYSRELNRGTILDSEPWFESNKNGPKLSLIEEVSDSSISSKYQVGDSTKYVRIESTDSKYDRTVGSDTKSVKTSITDSKYDLTVGTGNSLSIDGSGSGTISMKDASGNEYKTSSTETSISSSVSSKLNLGVQVELGNAAGGIKGSLDDLWSELSTVAQNLSTLASLCSSIAVTGPAAIVNGTAGAIPNIVASIASINAKKALVSTIFK